MDVHEYLDEALLELAKSESLDRENEADIFHRTFQLLDSALGDKAFKKWDGQAFSGKFLMSLFEVVATGVSKNLAEIESIDAVELTSFITQRCQDLWSHDVFTNNSGAGVRGTTRLANLLPLAAEYFRP